MATDFVLFESASGYALFETVDSDAIGSINDEGQAAVVDFGSFSRMVKLKAFVPFRSAEEALRNTNAVSEGIVDDTLAAFLQANLPKVKKAKKAKFTVGVAAANLGAAIQDELSFPCKHGEAVNEVIRGVRMHFSSFVKALKDGDLEKSMLGLGHSYSRSKVKFNVNRVDNMVIQSIATLDQLDKDVNTFGMRCREWYGYHFPELAAIVPDMFQYARCVEAISRRSALNEDSQGQLEEIVLDEDKATQIISAAKSSMGMDISDIDLMHVTMLAKRTISLAKYRNSVHAYLVKKINDVAPNLTALVGELVAGRLLSHAGSLVNLSKLPASTVQILGAEKALFRALKTKGNTPKYGLIYHSSFIGRASQKNKGRISRYLANKCAIASRIDSFSDAPTSAYGEELRKQVEERLSFYETGAPLRKNVEVMKKVASKLQDAASDDEDDEDAMDEEVKVTKSSSKKDKKKRKKSRDQEEEEEDSDDEEDAMEEEVTPKKSKKKKKSKDGESSSSSKKKDKSSKKKSDKKKKKKKKSDA